MYLLKGGEKTKLRVSTVLLEEMLLNNTSWQYVLTLFYMSFKNRKALISNGNEFMWIFEIQNNAWYWTALPVSDGRIPHSELKSNSCLTCFFRFTSSQVEAHHQWIGNFFAIRSWNEKTTVRLSLTSHLDFNWTHYKYTAWDCYELYLLQKCRGHEKVLHLFFKNTP